MPIRVLLDRVLLERRMSLTELADRVGVTIANLSILKTGKAKAIGPCGSPPWRPCAASSTVSRATCCTMSRGPAMRTLARRINARRSAMLHRDNTSP